jgi:hypothetical protein
MSALDMSLSIPVSLKPLKYNCVGGIPLLLPCLLIDMGWKPTTEQDEPDMNVMCAVSIERLQLVHAGLLPHTYQG